MQWSDFVLRLKGLLFRSRVEGDLDEELRFHLEMEARKNAAAGLDPAAAARQARIAFGGAEAIKEDCRDVRGTRWIEEFAQDIRFALRMLRKDRGYTLTAVAALAVGIGANTSLFTLFAALVLKPLPIPQPNAVVSLARTTAKNSTGGFFSVADYLYYRDHNSVFTSVASEMPAHLRLAGSANVAEPVMGIFVSANYLATFGVHPVAGRDFDAAEEQRTAGPFPALLSENYWRRHFGGDRAVLGQTLMLSGTPVTVIGITPLDFMGTRPDVPDAWILSAALGPAARRALARNDLSCALTARLKPSVTVAQAQAQMSSLAAALRADYPEAERAWKVQVENAARFGPAHRNFVGIFAILQVAMGLVLLIACSNVAGLLLGRAVVRQREIALRLSIGATRGRLIRQFLAEGVLLAVLAGAAAFLVSWQALSILSARASAMMLSEGGTIAIDATPDLTVFFYILAISIFAGISFALFPALQATRPDLAAALKDENAGLGIQGKARLRGWIVAAQVAVCLALLIGAGLLTSTSLRLLAIDPGFETDRLLRMTVASPEELGYSEAATLEFERRLHARLRAVPGVTSVSFASRIPLGGNITVTRVEPRGEANAAALPPFPYTYVSREYFETTGIPLLRGRLFTAQEVATNAPVVVITEALARRFWPSGDAIGKRIALGSPTEVHFTGRRAPNSPASEIIGIVRDSYSLSLLAPDPGAVYLPKPENEWNGLVFLRVAGDAKRTAAVLIREVRAAEARLPVSIDPMRDVIATGEASAFRIAALVFGAIGLVGFVLAAVGVYSMAAYSVSRQTREVGIRMALGAQRRDVVRLLLAGALRWIGGGLVAGATLGLVLSRVLASQLVLPGTGFLDPLVIFAISVGTGTLALLAAWLPVRRAARMDPALTLRFE
jgi:predicted permease